MDSVLLELFRKDVESFYSGLDYDTLEQAYKNIVVNITMLFDASNEGVAILQTTTFPSYLLNLTLMAFTSCDECANRVSTSCKRRIDIANINMKRREVESVILGCVDEFSESYFWHLVTDPSETKCSARVNDSMFDSWLPGDNSSTEYNRLLESNSIVTYFNISQINGTDQVEVDMSFLIYDWTIGFPSIFTRATADGALEAISLDIHFAINDTVPVIVQEHFSHTTMQLVFAGAVGGAVVVLLAIIALIAVTRSTRALDLNIWEFNNTMKSEEKAKKKSANK